MYSSSIRRIFVIENTLSTTLLILTSRKDFGGGLEMQITPSLVRSCVITLMFAQLLAFGTTPTHAKELYVSAASDLNFAFKELVTEFETDTRAVSLIAGLFQPAAQHCIIGFLPCCE